MQILTSHRSAFERQIREAIMIENYAGNTLLNSKMEYTRCGIPKMILKVGNKDIESEDSEIKREKNVIEMIKMKYKGEKKREKKVTEEKETEIVAKRRKLDDSFNDRVGDSNDIVYSNGDRKPLCDSNDKLYSNGDKKPLSDSNDKTNIENDLNSVISDSNGEVETQNIYYILGPKIDSNGENGTILTLSDCLIEPQKNVICDGSGVGLNPGQSRSVSELVNIGNKGTDGQISTIVVKTVNAKRILI